MEEVIEVLEDLADQPNLLAISREQAYRSAAQAQAAEIEYSKSGFGLMNLQDIDDFGELPGYYTSEERRGVMGRSHWFAPVG